jgi:ornithine cyclodeaminase
VQGRAHAEAFARAYPEADLRIVGRAAGSGERRDALRGAGIVVTATRSATALFDGEWVEAGAFVAAVGSSRPDTRELDDALLRRSARVIVEWREQSLREAGDLLLASSPVREGLDIIELGDALSGKVQARRSAGDIIVFKSVGIGLEDVSVAGLAYRLLR